MKMCGQAEGRLGMIALRKSSVSFVCSHRPSMSKPKGRKTVAALQEEKKRAGGLSLSVDQETAACPLLLFDFPEGDNYDVNGLTGSNAVYQSWSKLRARGLELTGVIGGQAHRFSIAGVQMEHMLLVWTHPVRAKAPMRSTFVSSFLDIHSGFAHYQALLYRCLRCGVSTHVCCNGCKLVRYCSRECQATDRALHASQCTVPKALRTRDVEQAAMAPDDMDELLRFKACLTSMAPRRRKRLARQLLAVNPAACRVEPHDDIQIHLEDVNAAGRDLLLRYCQPSVADVD